MRLASGREVEVWVLVGRPARLHGHPDSWHPDEGVELEVLDQVNDEERAEACRLALEDIKGGRHVDEG